MRLSTAKWQDLGEVEREKWYESATDSLIESGRLPLSDDVWATDKYAEIIEEKAQELWEDYRDEYLASLAE